MIPPRLLAAATLPLLLSLAACPGGGDPAAPDAAGDDQPPPDAEPPPDALVRPLFRNPVDLADGVLAMQALQLLGADVDGADRNCDICHGLTRGRLHAWQDLSVVSTSTCLTDLGVDSAAEARATIACLREDPDDDASPFDPARLGMYATAVHLPWFAYLFELAYPGEGAARQDELIERALMPRGGHAPFVQGEFDIVAEWVARGMPQVDTLVPEQPPGTCTPSIGPEVAAHVAAMATTGWQAVNAAAGINMHGCAGAAGPRACLADYPRGSSIAAGATWEQDLPGSVVRILATLDYQTSYWTRSSADGRFVAHGGGTTGSSTILDLATAGRRVSTTGYYDPGFFPDNTGFAFQGGGAYVCDQRLLTNQPFDDSLDYTEAECSPASSVALYQHMGATPGGDSWIVNSQWVGDNGFGGGDPYPSFDGSATIRLIPMIHSGTSFQERATLSEDAPYEGDTVLSPAAGLLVSRVASDTGQAGYRLRKLVATPNGDTYDVDIPVIATYCLPGAKSAISYDERWMVTHHYVSNTDADAIDLGFASAAEPGFQEYVTSNTANVYLVDLLSGDRTRITRMAPGQLALFPHFRSDGWIYINVRGSGGPEYIVASDAALLVAGQ